MWHIDYDENIWDSNRVNNTASHQYVDLEEADGSQSEYSRDGDSFPGASGITSFTDDTTPSMKTWSKERLNLPITDIAESADGVITFKVCGGREPLKPVGALEAENVGSESFTAVWESAGDDAVYMLSVYTRGVSGRSAEDEKMYVEGFRDRQIKGATSCEVTGLEPETDYYYTVAVGDGWEQSAPSHEIAVFTGRLPLNRRAVVAAEASEVGAFGFTAHWMELEDAESYVLNVYTKEWGAPMSDGCDFTGGVEAMPEGWSSTSGATYANSAYSGESVPSLRLGGSSDYLTTPLYADGVKTLSFWHRGNSVPDADRIRVSALVDDKWIVVAELPIVNESV